MISFTYLQMRNFLSFGNQLQSLDLSFAGTTLICGDNVDSDSKNGAGKTTILNAIAYALYNKPIAQISKERLINRTNASKTTMMEVRLGFDIGDDSYEIYRCRGESYSISLMQNGKDITPDSIASTDKKIAELIGISYELFCIAIVFSGPDQPFLSQPISSQRAIIEELFKITALSEKAIKLKEVIRGIDSDIKIQDALLKAQTLHVEQQTKRIADAEARVVKWETDREMNLGPLQEKIAALKLVDFKGQQELFAKLQELQKDLTKRTSELKAINLENDRRSREYNKLCEEVKHLKDEKCPYCLQTFADSGKKLEEMIDRSSSMSTDVDVRKQFACDEAKELENIKETEAHIKKQLTCATLAELLREQSSIMALEERFNDMQCGTNPHIEPLEALLLEDINEPDYGQLDVLKSELEHHQFLLKLLTDKNSFVRRKIINKTIPFLNKQINEYTTRLGLQHKVKFDSDMSCNVEEFGRQLDFGNLSSGEKKRVNIALSFAFRDVLHHLHTKINILMLDEMDAGLCAVGVEAAFGLIKQKTRDDSMSVWIISHRPEAEGRFDRSITVRKQSGFSTIYVD